MFKKLFIFIAGFALLNSSAAIFGSNNRHQQPNAYHRLVPQPVRAIFSVLLPSAFTLGVGYLTGNKYPLVSFLTYLGTGAFVFSGANCELNGTEDSAIARYGQYLPFYILGFKGFLAADKALQTAIAGTQRVTTDVSDLTVKAYNNLNQFLDSKLQPTLIN